MSNGFDCAEVHVDCAMVHVGCATLHFDCAMLHVDCAAVLINCAGVYELKSWEENICFSSVGKRGYVHCPGQPVESYLSF